MTVFQCAWTTRTDPWQRVALGAWTAGIAIVLLHVALAPRYSGVYPIFASAGRFWLAGDDSYQLVPGIDPYRYAPPITAFFALFSHLPDRAAGVLWRLLNAVALFTAVTWWARIMMPARARAWLLLFVLPLALGNIHNGQCNPLVLAMLLYAAAAVAAEHWNLAAVCTAFACLLKVYPVAFGLLLVLLYPRQLVGRFAAALLVGAALPFLLQRPDYVSGQYVSWLQRLGVNERTFMPVELWYRDLRLLCRVWLVPLPPLLYVAIQLFGAAGCALLCLAGRLGCWEPRRLLALLLAVSCVWMTVLGTAAESATYVLLAPSLACTLLETWREGRPRWLRAVALLSYTLLLGANAASWFPWGRSFHALGPHPFAALLLLMSVLAAELPVWRCGVTSVAQPAAIRRAAAA